jgi:hypothetical protein
MEARWQGENSTLTMPQAKAPAAARARPPDIHWLTVSSNRSIISIPAPGYRYTVDKRARDPPFDLERRQAKIHG